MAPNPDNPYAAPVSPLAAAASVNRPVRSVPAWGAGTRSSGPYSASCSQSSCFRGPRRTSQSRRSSARWPAACLGVSAAPSLIGSGGIEVPRVIYERPEAQRFE